MPQRPQPGEYEPYHEAYVRLVPEEDVLGVLALQAATVRQLVPAVIPGQQPVPRISPEREGFRYAAGKWSVREVFGHLGDAERVFGYRALCLARGQQEPLPSFDENLFVETGSFDERTLTGLADELILLRIANLSMLERLKEADWGRSCLVNGKPLTTRALAWIMAGHLRHHLVLLRDRYGVE